MKTVKFFILGTWIAICMLLPGVFLFATTLVANEKGWLEK